MGLYTELKSSLSSDRVLLGAHGIRTHEPLCYGCLIVLCVYPQCL
nr:MAG TPA: hypothetical protein [Caudoviricetes sp.]